MANERRTTTEVITAENKTANALKGAAADFNKYKSQLVIGGAAIGAALSLGKVFQANTAAFIEQQNQMVQQEARIKSTGNAAGISAAQMNEIASQLQLITNFGDEATLKATNLLRTFTNIKGTNFISTTKMIQDMTVSFGTLESNATLVGKALQDPIKGLSAMSRVGVAFTEDQKELIKSLVEGGEVAEAQRVILGELETQFGGSAAAAKDTLGGAITSMLNDFGDLQETIGGFGHEEFQAAIEQLGATIRAFNNIISETDDDLGLLDTTLAVLNDSLKVIINTGLGVNTVFDVIGEGVAGLVVALDFIAKGELEKSIAVFEAIPERVGDILEKSGNEMQSILDAGSEPVLEVEVNARIADIAAAADETVVEQSKADLHRAELEQIRDQQIEQDNWDLERRLALAEIEEEERNQRQENRLIELKRDREAKEKRAQAAKELATFEKNMALSVVQNSIQLLGALGKAQKLAAIAGLVVQKSQALSANATATAAGITLAYASQLVPGDPVGSLTRGALAAGKVKTLGAINAGLIIATGLGEAAQIAKGGDISGGGGGGGGGGSTPSIPQIPEPDEPRATTVNIRIDQAIDWQSQLTELAPVFEDLSGQNIDFGFTRRSQN